MVGTGNPGVSLRTRLVLAAVPLSTGGAVLVAIVLAQGSLVWPTLALLAATGASAAAVARGLDGAARQALSLRLRHGLLAGAAATAAYDAIRYVLVAVTGWTVRPFTVFALFGQMLVGDGPSLAVRYAVGTAFHVVNGLGFAVGYLIVFRRPRVWTAVAWAMVLEVVTVTFYPSWLGITALGELVSMSAVGHLAYGVVLGLLASRLVGRDPGAVTA